MNIEIIKISANTTGFMVGRKECITIDSWNVTFYFEKHSNELITKIEPITIKIKEIPDSTEELEKIIFNEFAKLFQQKG
ncbi:hypothetical protein DFR79_13229 [Halanaerobium saccharolyticum]|uniref:Uncharacterized protein n=1 Tax=Halanaerobium saccharolyticum TaxID=43595 RepID=A0A4R6LE20_9FIRM|nr:hypothetical protein [Halanaerobium saccharolyticum]TDO77697.1 hypothetical protein DFR79_13229 [Halanaerobium saccharolyticum]